MKAAKDIYDSQGLGAWSVYTSGAYKNHLPGSFTPAAIGETASAPSQTKSENESGLRMAGEASEPTSIVISNIAKMLGFN